MALDELRQKLPPLAKKEDLMQVTNLSKLLATFVVLAPSLSFASATSEGWYAGVDIGHSNNKFESDDTGKIMVAGTLSTVVDGTTSPGLRAGYQFNEIWCVEAGYTKIGNFKIHVTMPNGRSIAEDYRVDAWTLAGTISKQLANKFFVFGKIGAAFTKVNDTYQWSDNTKLYAFTKRRTNPLLGIGMKYAMSPEVALRVEYEHFGEVGSAITGTGEGTARARDSRLSIGVTYHF